MRTLAPTSSADSAYNTDDDCTTEGTEREVSLPFEQACNAEHDASTNPVWGTRNPPSSVVLTANSSGRLVAKVKVTRRGLSKAGVLEGRNRAKQDSLVVAEETHHQTFGLCRDLECGRIYSLRLRRKHRGETALSNTIAPQAIRQSSRRPSRCRARRRNS
ncbi:hypothetical protein TOPH_07144 [Tolypocladium ophioglossoides CBS 100239]|uniref:Uncharacterized protein n=1 Tax=Tolypocladium ophioglossoides (strain CBS 100239) TaxID=1163406 RepID=A0A0L0N258_TOLOC|nr:hypothetical protein TOPH_07144 [Tolypocladium ophioglossoides CBS 100239]